MLNRGFRSLAQARDIEAARQKVNDLEAQMQQLATSSPNIVARFGAGIEQKLEDARATLHKLLTEQQQAAFAVDDRPPPPRIGGGDGVTTAAGAAVLAEDDKIAEELQKRFDAREDRYITDLERRLEFLRQSMLSEEELAKEKHALEMETLVEALEARALTEQQYMLMSEDLEMQHMDEIANIRQRGMKKIEDISEQSFASQLKGAANFMKGMTANAASGSRAMFNINKAASIAEALLSARASITKAYEFGSKFGPGVAAAFAATAAAATAAQVRQLASTSFNSGASAAGSVSASGITAPSALPAATLPNTGGAGGSLGGGGQTVTINLQGETFGRDAVRNLITEINEAISEGAVLRLA
jgi:hypothetical protein